MKRLLFAINAMAALTLLVCESMPVMAQSMTDSMVAFDELDVMQDKPVLAPSSPDSYYYPSSGGGSNPQLSQLEQRLDNLERRQSQAETQWG